MGVQQMGGLRGVSGRPSWKSSFVCPFRLFRRVQRAPRESRKRRKQAFFLRYTLFCLNLTSGKKKEPKPKLFGLDVSGGVGSSTWTGGGQKVQYVPRNTGKLNFWAGYPGISQERPKSLRKKVCVQFSLPIKPPICSTPNNHRWVPKPPPGANLGEAETARWQSSQGGVAGSAACWKCLQNPVISLAHLTHWTDPSSHSQGRLFQPPGGQHQGG